MSTILKNPIVHGVITAVLFLIPIVLHSGAPWLNVTIGGALAGLWEVLKNKSSGLTMMGAPKK